MEVFKQDHPNGFVMALGSNLRPPDPREQKYALRTSLPPRTADLSQSRLLSRWQGVGDLRPEIANQGPVGCCAATSGVQIARLLARQTGRFDAIAPMLTFDYIYEYVRKKEGTWPQDAGSYPADVDDMLLSLGAPLESQYSESNNAAYDYGDIPTTALSGQIWIASHHPFYPTEGSILEDIWSSLDAGYPIHLSCAWPNQWFNPTQGVVTTNFTANDYAGGHATYIWGIVPSGTSGYVLCANQWSNGWTPDAPQSGLADMRAGDYAIPWSVFTQANTPIWECRAVAPLPYQKPQPQPAPPQDFSLSMPFWTWVTKYHSEVFTILDQQDPADKTTFDQWAAWFKLNGYIGG